MEVNNVKVKKIMSVKMKEQGFIPLSSQFGIPGISYQVQLGLIDNRWTSRLLKGNVAIGTKTYPGTEFPNQNEIVAWILQTIVVPGINPHKLIKTVQIMIKQAIEKRQEQRELKIRVSDIQNIKLKKVPESELKRPKVLSWIEGKNYLKHCSSCDGNLEWKFCPFCGKPLL